MAETVKGLNIKLSLDGKDLENELRGIKKDLKEQNKDLRAINTNLRYDSTNLDLWKQKQGKLNDILVQTKKKLLTQNQELEKAKKAVQVGDMSKEEFNKLKRNVQYSEASIAKLNGQLERTSDKIKQLSNANFEKIGKLGSTLTKSVTVPILGAVSALTAFSVKTAYTADEIGDTAEKLGLSAEQMQEWNHSATILGVSTERMERAFMKVNGVLGDIATGNGEKYADSLSLIGLTLDDLEGKNTDEAFNLIRDALSEVEDEAIRVGVANDLLSERVAADIIPVLSSEASVINDLKNEAQELGIVTNEQASQAGEFTDALDRTKQSLSSLGVELVSMVLPVLQELIIKVKDDIIPTFKDWLTRFNNLDGGTKKMIATLVGFVAAVGPVLSVVGKVGPLLNIASMGLKAVGTSGIFAGVGINAATLGIGALIAIIAVALFQSEEFKALLGRLMETFMQLLPPIMAIVDSLMTALQPILDVVIDLVVMLVDILTPILDVLLIPLITQVEMFAEILTMLAPLIQIVGEILTAVLVPAINVLKTVLEPVLSVVQKIVEFIQKIFEWIGDLPSKIGDFGGKVKDTFSNVTEGISNIASKVTDGISDFASDAADKVGGFFGGIGDFFSDTFNLRGTSVVNNNANASSSTQNTNNITINTTSPTFDIDSINAALGGSVI
jgi:phage-related minor tail protein